MTTILFRLVHYLPTAHMALGIFSALAGLWVLAMSVTEQAPPGLESLAVAGGICRGLAVLYLFLAAVFQFRLSRSGYSILSQPSRLWVLYVADQYLLLLVLLAVLARAYDSRTHLAGLHHGISALLVVAGLSLALAIIDRVAASGLGRAVPDWGDETEPGTSNGLAIAFLVVGTLLWLSLGFLEAQALPHVESVERAGRQTANAD